VPRFESVAVGAFLDSVPIVGRIARMGKVCRGRGSPAVPALALAGLLSGSGWAQVAGGYSAEPSKEAPSYETVVRSNKPSPPETQDRVFSASRFWLLDPGHYEVETWWTEKFSKDAQTEGLFQIEIEIGLVPHLQLDVYQNFSVDNEGKFDVEGNQIEMRYSFGRTYNQIPLNPVLYLEWHPRKGAQDRAEGRLLLGGNLAPRLLWATNLFFESNVNYFKMPSAQGGDIEAGATLAASYAVLPQLRLGLETKVGVDQHSDPTFYPMALVGPNVLLKSTRLGLKLTATAFVGLAPKDPRIQILAIAGWAF
jgi:hypothetical protein